MCKQRIVIINYGNVFTVVELKTRILKEVKVLKDLKDRPIYRSEYLEQYTDSCTFGIFRRQ